MAYELPMTKTMNHCKMTWYDGKECTGEVVYCESLAYSGV